MLGIGFIDTIWIPCICLACLSKLANPCNTRQDKYNKVQYKCEINSVFTGPYWGHTIIFRLFILLIVKKTRSNQF